MARTYEVTATALNLRSAPSTTGAVLAVLRHGQTCLAAGDAAQGWLPVVFDRFSGFVGERFVRPIGGNPPGVAVPPAAPPAATAADAQTKLRDLSHLHPRFRSALQALLDRTAAEGLPFRVFEAFRTPQRQEWLYAQGRTRPGGKVTNARAWQSFHQFGLAADLVLFIDGSWSWSDAGPLKLHWRRLRELASSVGLRSLDWEAPHVEWPVPLADATSASLLAQGDEDWLDHLQLAAQRWQVAGGGGGPVLDLADRPPLPVA